MFRKLNEINSLRKIGIYPTKNPNRNFEHGFSSSFSLSALALQKEKPGRMGLRKRMKDKKKALSAAADEAFIFVVIRMRDSANFLVGDIIQNEVKSE